MTDPSSPRPNLYQTEAERELGRDLVRIFEASTDSVEDRLANFPRYALRTQLSRFLALSELFKRILTVKGSIVECGVFRGFSLFTWAKLSSILEPANLHRRIYGFDSFAGFGDPHPRDLTHKTGVRPGDFAAGNEPELRQLIGIHDRDRFLGHLPKVEIISGDMTETVPAFVRDHRHLVISLLFLDVDLYEPTKLALESFLPYMHAGSIVAFDELDNPRWPGETEAAMEVVGLRNLRLERFEFDPHISFSVLR